MNKQGYTNQGNGPCGNNQPYEVVPGQLSNQELLEEDRKESKSENWIFPKGTIVDDRGRLTNPSQFIVAGKGRAIDKLRTNLVFFLKPEGGGADSAVKVKVLKSRKSAPHGKRYVLLEAAESIIGLEDVTLGIYRGATETQSIGVIHPSESNSGGGQSHSVQSYGVALLVRMKTNRAPLPMTEIRQKSRTATFEQDAELGMATIAVLDSGIRFRGSATRPTVCSDVGWDFVADDAVPDGTPFPNDDHFGLHGTKICSIIKNEAPGAGILPVKVSNSKGRLTLYDALCGLEYARTHGAKIVNASWSFTADGDNDEGQDFPLLLQAIRDLEESGIVVVAAAGNKNQYNSDANGHIGGQIPDGIAPKIYPACYSAIQDNVITVTTVVAPTAEDNEFSVFENYSNRFVDTGAVANAGAPEPDGQFMIPGFSESYRGTSFATPYVAAKIAQILYATPGYTGKRTLLRRLREFHVEDKLATKIRDGGSYITL